MRSYQSSQGPILSFWARCWLTVWFMRLVKHLKTSLEQENKQIHLFFVSFRDTPRKRWVPRACTFLLFFQFRLLEGAGLVLASPAMAPLCTPAIFPA